MKRNDLVLGLVLSLAAPAGAAVQPDQVGTLTTVGSYACVTYPQCSLLDFAAMVPSDPDGMPGQSSASSDLGAGDPNGTARAEVMSSGALEIPTLRAEAFSTAAGGTVAFAFGAQAYQITDVADLLLGGVIEIGVTLTGTIFDTLDAVDPIDALLPPALLPSPDLTRIEVQAGIVATNSGFSLLDLPADPIGAFAQLDSYVEHDSVFLAAEDGEVNDGAPMAVNEADTLSVAGLGVGSEVIVYAAIVASSDGAGNFADAFSTVELEFLPTSDSVALATAIPLPAPAFLLAGGLAALALRRRT